MNTLKEVNEEMRSLVFILNLKSLTLREKKKKDRLRNKIMKIQFS